MRIRRRPLLLGVLTFAVLAIAPARAEQSASPERSRVVRLTLEVRGEARSSVRGRIVATPLTTGVGTPRPTVRPLPKELSQGVDLDLDSRWSWRVVVEATGFWSVPTVLSPRDREALIELLPTAPIEVHGEVPHGREPPSSLTLEARPAPGERDFPAARIECPRHQELWRCEVPAGRIDLKIVAEGYVPVYVWGLRLVPSKRHSLDTGELRTGASLSGFVTTAEGDGAGAAVHLEPALILPESSGRENTLAAEAQVNDRGFFLFAGVAPGEYVVSARKKGYATARSEPLRVEEDSETRLLSALWLERPVELEVFVSPPVDPFGEPWQVEATRDDLGSRRAHEGARHAATDAGAWSQPGLEPAFYLLRVFDSRGSSVTERRVHVTKVSPPVELSLDVVPVQGRVRRGERPVQGELTLTGIPGGRIRRIRRGYVLEPTTKRAQEAKSGEAVPDTRRVRFDSDTEGHFAGYLPNEGFWEVEVDTADGAQVRLSDPVEVRRPDGGGPAEVEIEIPDTRLEVRVRDRAGRPAAGTALTLIDEAGGPVASGETGPEGDFSFLGVPEQPLVVEARARRGATATVRAEPRSGEETRIEMVLEPTIRVHGVVASPAGPVPGVLLSFQAADALAPRWTTATTGADGRFRFSVPAGTSAVEVIVLAPGLPVHLARMPIEPSEGLAQMNIVLQDVGGTLRLAIHGGGDLMTKIQVAHGGAVVDLTSLMAALVSTPVRLIRDGAIALPMEAGSYSVCMPAPDCRQVFVSPGSSTTVALGGGTTDSGGG